MEHNRARVEYENLSPVWLKAAVVGGLWASAEIILGSFLHNLRIPFAGSVLAAAGTLLLISFHRQWPEKGLIWRSGLICALMKSISPSSIILGPMIGIMLEALLLEMSIRLFGKNLPGYILGGILSVSSALMHKIFSLLIMYGDNVVEIYKNMFFFAVKQLKMSQADPVNALLILAGVYVIMGFFTAIAGILIGNRAHRNRNQDDDSFSVSNFRNRGYDQFTASATSPVRLLLMIFVLIGFLLMQNRLPLYLQLIATGSLAFLSIFRYGNMLRRFGKYVFWLQLVIMLVLAIFFTYNKSGTPDYRQGFINGTGMIMRALFVVLSFSVISVEMRNPLVRVFLENKGFSQLYQALHLSFSALPEMMDQLPRARDFFRHPAGSVARILKSADAWLKTITRLEALKMIHIRQVTQDELILMLHGFQYFEEKTGITISEGSLESPEVIPVLLDFASRNEKEAGWWLPYFIFLKKDGPVVGMCGFKGAPDANHSVEIGYGTATGFRNRGIAGYAARWLIHQAFTHQNITEVIAHTLPAENASVKVLKKIGFQYDGDGIDPDEGLVWRWKLKKI